jgi:hypothetical protein
MTAIRWIIAVATLAILTETACFGPRYRWESHWRGNRNLRGQPGADKTVLHTVGMIDLTLNPNYTFDLFDSGAPKLGSYRISGDAAFLAVKTVFGRATNGRGQEIQLTQKDAKTIVYFDPADANGRRFELKRIDDPR